MDDVNDVISIEKLVKVRCNVHIHVATQNVILTFWVGGWVD